MLVRDRMKMKLVTSLLPASKMLSYELTDKQYSRCLSAAIAITKRRKKDWKSDWHKSAFSEPHKATMIGLCGEIAFYQILSTYFKKLPHPDLSVNDKRKQSDFIWSTPFGSKHEIKTTVQSPEGGVNYLRKQAADRSDLFWFLSTVDVETRLFYLRGFATQDHLKKYAIEKKGRGNWINLVIETDDLLPVNKLIKLKK